MSRFPCHTLDRISQISLPGAPRVTWLDLLQQVGLEHGVRATEIIGTKRISRIARARHHFWGVLRGAGYSYSEISMQLDVSDTAIARAIEKALRRLLDQPIGHCFGGQGEGAGI